ncbi:hypothetical protein [Streptomyces zhihengii]|uniref:hypothetical protein n=1 Tax=Streptomyces zhihengii TaxID=1818004 RepID=UPI003606F22C
MHPQHGSVRGRRYTKRRQRLLDLVGGLGPPIQALPAMVWYETLQAQGVEGIVAKRAGGTYRGGAREWRKIRHAETEDLVVGYTGARSRPRALDVRRPDGASPSPSASPARSPPPRTTSSPPAQDPGGAPTTARPTPAPPSASSSKP